MNLTTQTSAPRQPLDVNLSARQNIDPVWFARLQKIGLEIIAVRFAAERHSPIWSHPEIGKGLGLELSAAGLGMYDSSAYPAANQFHFFHSPDFGKAISLLKNQIGVRGLLPIAHICHRETADTWRCYWSPDEKEIAQTICDEVE